MKPFLILSFLFLVITTNAKNYYISATGSDSNNGLTPATAWQTITKLNASWGSINAGDNIYFERGGSFYGTINPAKSGTAALPVLIGDYGTGAKPIITGFKTISSWTSLGGNIYEAIVPNGLSSLNMVVMNGAEVPIGRYPNTGYRTYSSFVNMLSITDPSLTGTPNWKGAELVVKRNPFSTNRVDITNHAGTTLSFNTSGGTSFEAGMGYFIENHLSTLDQNGEWMYDSTSHKIKMYYSGTPPSIDVSTLANLVNMVYTNVTVKSYIKFSNINFQGCEEMAMLLTWCNNITVDNCDFKYIGESAIYRKYNIGLTVQNSTFSDINCDGIYSYNGSVGSTITVMNSNFKRIGMNPGMITKKNLAAYVDGATYCGIVVVDTDALIQENTFDSIGYAAIALMASKNNQIVRKNIISNFCAVKNDGGAIYNGGLRGGPAATNIIIDNNIIFKSLDASAGTTTPLNPHTRGIYLDATSAGVNVLNNTVFDSWGGIYLSNAQNNIIRGNTVYNSGGNSNANNFEGQLAIADGFSGFARTRNNTITKNIFFSKISNQLSWLHGTTDSVGYIGTIDSNYYVNPFNYFPSHNANVGNTIYEYSFKMWHSAYPNYDIHSKVSPIMLPTFTVSSLVGANKSPNEFFTSDLSGTMAQSSPVVHTFTWDNTSKITGTGSAKLSSSVTSSNFTGIYQIVGAVTAGKKYLLRFKTRATKLGTFQTHLLQYTGCYCLGSSSKNGIIDTALQQHEVILSWDTTSQTNAALYIEFSQNTSTIYIDDIQFNEATIAPTNPDDYLRFEYNATNADKTITLDAKYIGADSTVYNGSITLKPFTSSVLIKSGAITSSLTADAGTDISLILPINTTVLKGTASGTVTSYLWTKIAGPNQFTIASPNNPSTAINNLAMGKYTFQLKVMNSIGDTAVATVNIVMLGVLPVTLIDFTAKNNNEKIALQWKVSSEINVSHYTIERSGISQSFENIGEVSANNLFAVQGNYYFDDNFPLQGINYYRLAMIDIDGTTKYSKTISATETNISSFKLSKLLLSANNNNLKIGIYSNYQQLMQVVLADVSGKILYTNTLQLQKGFNDIDKKINFLNTGVYYARLFTNNQVITKTLLSKN